MLVTITLKSGDENAVPEMATGYVETDSIQALVDAADGELVNGEIVCEWGNGEGSNVYTVDIIEAHDNETVFHTETATDGGDLVETYVKVRFDNANVIRYQANLEVTRDGLSAAADGWGEEHDTLTAAINECQDMLVDWLNTELIEDGEEYVS